MRKRKPTKPPEPTTSVVRVLHASEHGTTVVPVRTYGRRMSVDEVRDNLRRYPIPGVDPLQVTPLEGGAA